MLQQKHPSARVPEDCDFDNFLDTAKGGDPFPLLFFEEDVKSSAYSSQEALVQKDWMETPSTTGSCVE